MADETQDMMSFVTSGQFVKEQQDRDISMQSDIDALTEDEVIIEEKSFMKEAEELWNSPSIGKIKTDQVLDYFGVAQDSTARKALGAIASAHSFSGLGAVMNFTEAMQHQGIDGETGNKFQDLMIRATDLSIPYKSFLHNNGWSAMVKAQESEINFKEGRAKEIFDATTYELQKNLIKADSMEHLEFMHKENQVKAHASRMLSEQHPNLGMPAVIATSLMEPIALSASIATAGGTEALMIANATRAMNAANAASKGVKTLQTAQTVSKTKVLAVAGVTEGITVEALQQGMDFNKELSIEDLAISGSIGLFVGFAGGQMLDFMAKTGRYEKFPQAFMAEAEFTKGLDGAENAQVMTMPADFTILKGKEKSDVPMLKKVFWMPFITGTSRGLNHDNGNVRNFFQRISNGRFALTNADGSVNIRTSGTGKDERRAMDAVQTMTIRGLEIAHFNHVKGGGKLKEEAFMQHITDNIRAVKSDVARKQQEAFIDVDKQISARRSELEKAVKKKKLRGVERKNALANMEKELFDLESSLKADINKGLSYDDVLINALDKKVPGTKDSLRLFDDYADKAGKKVFGETSTHLPYFTRTWSSQKITAIGEKESANIVYEAMLKSPQAKAIRESIDNSRLSGEEMMLKTAELENGLRQSADGVIKKITGAESQNDLLEAMGDLKFVDPLTMKSRSVDVIDDDIMPLLDNDMKSIFAQYSRKMNGKAALIKAFGTDKKSDIDKIVTNVVQDAIRDARASGMKDSKVDIMAKNLREDMEVQIDHLRGDREVDVNKNKFGNKYGRMARKFNTATWGGAFTFSTIPEIGSVIAAEGIQGIKHFMPVLKQLKSAYKKGGHKDEILDTLNGMGIGLDVHNSRSMTRLVDEDDVGMATGVENLLDKANAMQYHVNGMAAMTSGYDMMIAYGMMGNMISSAKRLSKGKKLSKANTKKFARLGLSNDDIMKIGKEAEAFDSKAVESFELKSWKDQELAERVKLAVSEQANSFILKPDATTLPNYFSEADAWFFKLVTQFMSYPVASYESLLLKGMSEMDAKFLAGSMTSAGAVAGVYYAREQAVIATGMMDEDDAKYDIFTDEGQKNVMYQVIKKHPVSTIFPTAYEAGATYMGQPLIGTDYREKNVAGMMAGATASRMSDISDSIQDIWKKDHVTAKQMRTLKSNIPLLGLPGISDGLNAYIKNNYD